MIHLLKTHYLEAVSLCNIFLGLILNDWMLVFQLVLICVGVMGGLVSMWIKIDNHLFEKRKRRREDANI